MSRESMAEQLAQVFMYAELLKRLTECQELLDPKGGYLGEGIVYEEILDLQNTIRNNMKQHLSNSRVSDRAMSIISNTRYFVNKAKS